jgi:hypothetical protein
MVTIPWGDLTKLMRFRNLRRSVGKGENNGLAVQPAHPLDGYAGLYPSPGPDMTTICGASSSIALSWEGLSVINPIRPCKLRPQPSCHRRHGSVADFLAGK